MRAICRLAGCPVAWGLDGTGGGEWEATEESAVMLVVGSLHDSLVLKRCDDRRRAGEMRLCDDCRGCGRLHGDLPAVWL